MIVSVTARTAFDFAIRGDGRVPITLICEEAHNYIPADSALGFQPARRAIAKIAKEGRKYGVCIGVVTQRPSELDPTILSQCNTVISMRLSNELDQQLVRSAVSDAAAGLMRFLPSLASGEAIAFGDGVPLPMRLTFRRLPAHLTPGGAVTPFSQGWAADSETVDYAREIVERWRKNEPTDRAAATPQPTKRPQSRRRETRRDASRDASREGWGRKET